jgi:SURF4 family protein
VLLGYQTRLGAWLLTLFLIPVTLTMHNFWAAPDARAFQLESALFLRNVALLGGAPLIGHFGGGPLSLDALLHRGKEVIGPIRTPSFTHARRPSQTASEDASPVRQRMSGSRS